MAGELDLQIRKYADVIVRVGLNLQAGQPLLITDPFELQGVAREAAGLVSGIEAAARAAGGGMVSVLWASEARLRDAAERWPDPEFEMRLAAGTGAMHRQIDQGGALLFLQSSDPHLMDGVSPTRLAAMRARCCDHYGRVATRLVAGETNWTVAPAPTGIWARSVYGERCDDALARLWSVVLEANRIGERDSFSAWAAHVGLLREHRDRMNTQRLRAVRLYGEGTDLVVPLCHGHRWCTAALQTRNGLQYIANLPTEEVFTAPDRKGTSGFVRVARGVACGGTIIEGIELEFRRGVAVGVRARRGQDLLRRLLNSDAGAARLGEVALLVRRDGVLAGEARCFQHPLLDENALPHIALGDGYPFSVRDVADPGLNHSVIHIDLPVDAQVEVSG